MTHADITLKDAQHVLQRFEIRPLRADDAPAYFALRERVLKMGDGHYFSDSYTREAELVTEQQRREWCTEKRGHCVIGAFANGALRGIVMITRLGPSEDLTAEWEAAWVDPQYRRTGLTKALYQQVQQWTVDQGYAHVKVFIRQDNERWLDIRRRQGFVQIGTKRNELWADGTSGDTHIFTLDLRNQNVLRHGQQAIRHLDATLASLTQEPGAIAVTCAQEGIPAMPAHIRPRPRGRGLG